MASEQFSQAVRGSGGQPIATSAIGSIDTNDYPEGDAGETDGTTYPVSINPAEVIKELGLQIVGAETTIEITTTAGRTFSFPVDAPTTFDRWDVDSVELSDPDGNQGRLVWWWAGE